MKVFLMYVVGLASCALAIYLDDPAAHKAGAFAFFGIGLLVPAIVIALVNAMAGDDSDEQPPSNP
jgi:hypothetical protein